MATSELPPERREMLVSASRATVGEELRSMVHFTDDSVEQLYLRDDLDRTADLAGFAALERHGFVAREGYTGTQLGEYGFTIRVFDDGYLTRVVDDDRGVWVTTDAMSIDRFEELASALVEVVRGDGDRP